MSARIGKTGTNRVLLPRNQFVDMIQNTNKSLIVSMLYRGKPKMRVTNNPYPDAVVQYRLNGGINWSYAKMVRRRKIKVYSLADAKADDLDLFMAKPRSWGIRRVVNSRFTAIVDHKGKEYVTILPTSYGPRTYYNHGSIVPECVLKPFLTEKDPSALVKSQGLLQEDAVDYKDICLSNVMTVTMNHCVYDLI